MPPSPHPAIASLRQQIEELTLAIESAGPSMDAVGAVASLHEVVAQLEDSMHRINQKKYEKERQELNAAKEGDEEPEQTFQDLFSNGDLLDSLCAALGPGGVAVVESTCKAFRTALDPYWQNALEKSGFATELHIPDAHLKTVQRRVVVLETRRRATFPERLIIALKRLGLNITDDPEVRCQEQVLQLLQYRHGFLLDRRYSRQLRWGPNDKEKFPFYPDTLPGHPNPSPDSAASRNANGLEHLLEGYEGPNRNAKRVFPQRAAFIPLATWQRTRAAADTRIIARAGRDRPMKLSQALRESGLDAESKPQLEELLEGRDIELCAMAPVLGSGSDGWRRAQLGGDAPRAFSPPTLPDGEPDPDNKPPMFPDGRYNPDLGRFWDPWDLIENGQFTEIHGDLVGDIEGIPASDLAFRNGLSYPEPARFEWQITDGLTGTSTGTRGQKYHRMAKYTSERGRSWLWKKGEPQKIRHATPVERLRCTSLAEHGLVPGGASIERASKVQFRSWATGSGGSGSTSGSGGGGSSSSNVTPALSQTAELAAALSEEQLHPESASAHRRVGTAHEAMGDAEQAAKSYDKAIALERAQAPAAAAEDEEPDLSVGEAEEMSIAVRFGVSIAQSAAGQASGMDVDEVAAAIRAMEAIMEEEGPFARR